MMRSAWYWARSTAGRRVGGLGALALVIALGAGAAMGAAAGARRTASAVDRLEAVSNMPQAIVLAADLGTFDRLTSGPEVEATTANMQLGLQPAAVSCSDDGASYFPVLASTGADPFAVSRPHLLDGRLPAQSAADEAVVSEGHADRLGVGVGDRLAFLPYVLDPDTGEATGCGDEVVAEVEVVGVVREVEEIGSNGEPTRSHTYLTAAFLEAHPELAELQLPGVGGLVRLTEGVDPGAFVAEVRDGFPLGDDGSPMGLALALDGPNPVEPAMKALSVGLWGLSGVLAVATAITFAAATSRQVAAGDAERRTLVGLGFDRAGLVASTSLVGVGAAAVGTLVAVAVAAGLSTAHLIGVAGKVEPDPGFDLDPAVLATGAGITIVYAAAVTTLTAWRAATRSRHPATARPTGAPGLVDRIVRIGAPPWAALGTDYALGRGRGVDGVIPARVAVTGVVAGTAGFVAVLIFGVGVGQATEEPSVYGWGDWDARVEMDVLDPEIDPAAVLSDDPAVATVAGLSLRFDLPIDGVTVAGTPVRQFVGHTGPTVIRGRLPSGAEEIGLGVDTADRLDVDLGDTVRIDGPTGTGDVRVVGLLVVPSIDSESITQGWHLDREALDVIGFEPGCNAVDCFQSLALSWRAGADVDAATARLAELGLHVVLPEPGPEVVLIGHADQLPTLAAIGVGLLAGIGLVHTLAVTVRRRRRDLAVGRALGFSPRQSGAVLLTEGLALGIVGAAVGGLLGTIVGRVAWRAAAAAMGIGSQLPPTAGLVAVVVLGVVALSVVASVIPAIHAARLRPADGLRSS